MKRTVCILLLLVVTASWGFAQDIRRQTVYLKNGSIIKGFIIEQQPNRSIKIQTADGSVFAYPMREVEKITYDVMTPQEKKAFGIARPSHDYKFTRPTGYRGFVDFGGVIGTGDFSGVGRMELSTSHGYQFNPHIFFGGGMAAQYNFDGDVLVLPLYADFRYNLLPGRITPFAGLKMGYSVATDFHEMEGLGFYCLPSVGARFMVKDNLALNLSLGYTIQSVEAFHYHNGHYYYSDWMNWGGVALKVGVEF